MPSDDCGHFIYGMENTSESEDLVEQNVTEMKD